MAISITKIQKERNTDNKTLPEIREAILAAAREAAAAERHDELVIELPQGEHLLSEPFVLSAKENPELSSVSITLRAAHSMRPAVHSRVAIDGRAFVPVEGKPYFRYQFEKGEDGKYPLFHDLYLDGKKIPMASSPIFRTPNGLTNEERKGIVAREGMYLPLEMAERLADSEISGTELGVYIEWEFAFVHVESVDLACVKEFGDKKYALARIRPGEMMRLAKGCHPILDIACRETFLRNTTAYLTEPNTYAYDSENGLLYFIPEIREHMKWARLSYPTLETLFILEGLSDFTLEGIRFTGTTSKFISENGYISGQANYEKQVGRLRHAAVCTSNMRGFTVRDCTFRDLGGNGLLMTDRSVKVHLYDNRFENIAMSALSVGNPTTEWENESNRNYGISIINNRFERIGYEYPSALCMYVGIVDGLKILHNTVEGCAYSAISVGWGWDVVGYELGAKVNVRDADIAFNKFHNFMDVLRDGAAIYVLGANCHESNSRRFNFMHDNYASLDNIRDASKRGYYMDGAASNWEVYHNVIDNCALPVFSQFHVSEQFTHHNYIYDIYSTTPIDKGNHAPYRDTILGECYEVTEGGVDALIEAYPVVAEIRDLAGCDLAY